MSDMMGTRMCILSKSRKHALTEVEARKRVHRAGWTLGALQPCRTLVVRPPKREYAATVRRRAELRVEDRTQFVQCCYDDENANGHEAYSAEGSYHARAGAHFGNLLPKYCSASR